MKFFLIFALSFLVFNLIHVVGYLRRIAEVLENLACDDEEDVEESEVK